MNADRSSGMVGVQPSDWWRVNEIEQMMRGRFGFFMVEYPMNWERISWRMFVCACVVMVVTARPVRADGPVTRAAGASFSGDWESTFGLVHLEQVGDSIRGKYGIGGGEASISGLIKGKRLMFKYKEPTATGEGWFELSADGSKFSGQWKQDGSNRWMPWEGKRAGGIVPDSFAGLWRTDFGHMRLWQSDEKVHGVFELGGKSKIEGKMSGRMLKFNYEQTDGEKGEGSFELAEIGRAHV